MYIAIVCVAGAAWAEPAEPATARFASAQLEFASAALRRAESAVAAHEYATVPNLAAQAALDARLAWRMTDSGFVRRAAIEINAQAERLRRAAVLAGSGLAVNRR